MRRYLLWLGIACFVLIAFTPRVFALPPYATALAAFNDKGYAEYLSVVDEDPGWNKTADLECMTRMAIALERTQGWEMPVGKQVLDHFNLDAKSRVCFMWIRALVAGDPKGLEDYTDPTTHVNYQNTPGDFRSLIPLFRAHDATVGADMIAAGCTAFPTKDPLSGSWDYSCVSPGVKAWVALPDAVFTAVTPRLVSAGQAYARNQAFGIALAYSDRKASTPTEIMNRTHANIIIYELGKSLGKLNLSYVRNYVGTSTNKNATAYVATRLAKDESGNVWTQMGIASLFRNYNLIEEAATIYIQAATGLPEPERRELRIACLGHRQTLVDEGQSPAPLDAAATALLKGAVADGDRMFIEGKQAQATEAYEKVMNDTQAPLGERLSAWGGLLDCDPGRALLAGDGLLKAVVALAEPDRTRLLGWMGWELWRAASPAVPATPIQTNTGVTLDPSIYEFLRNPLYTFKPEWAPRAAVSFTADPDVLTRAADLLARIIALAPAACLVPDTERQNADLRFGAAALFLLAGRAHAASDVCFTGATATVTTAGVAVQTTHPTDREVLALVLEITYIIERCPPMQTQKLPLAAALVGALAARKMVAPPPPPSETATAPRTSVDLTQALLLAVRAADATPDPGAALRPVADALNASLKPTASGDYLLMVTSTCLLEALHAAVTQGSREALFTMLLTGYDALNTLLLKQTPDLAAQRMYQYTDQTAGFLEKYKNQPCPELVPYAARLRAKYPKP